METSSALQKAEHELVSWWRGEEEKAKKKKAPSPASSIPMTSTPSSSAPSLLLAARGGHWCKLSPATSDDDDTLVRAVYAASVLNRDSETTAPLPEPPVPGCFACVVARRDAAAALPVSSSSSSAALALAADAERLRAALTEAADQAEKEDRERFEISAAASAAVFEAISYPEPLLLLENNNDDDGRSLERALCRLLLLLGDALDLGASRYAGSYFLLCSSDSRVRSRARAATASAGGIEGEEDAAAAGAGLRRAAKVVLLDSKSPSSSASASASASASSSKDGRYEVFATHGKGVFSTVLRARDLASAIGNGTTAAGAAAAGVAANVEEKPESVTTSTTPTYSEVAIKVIRANELMRRAGALEASILEKLAAADPSGKRHCVRLLTQFDHRGHLCLVFEPLDSDLRALASRYGRGVGLSLAAARAYATQLLLALSHVASCGIVHADVKPDNVLVSKDRSRVVLADFGSALSVGGDNEVTPYLVSRFYRAPEIILGLRYSYPCDVWSLGCLLFELYTGKVAFPGKTNNEMLAMFQSLKGAIPKKMVKKGAFSGRHFELVSSTSSSSAGTAGGGNEQYAFAATRDDPISGRPMRTVVAHARVEADVAARLSNSNAMTFSTAEERADVAALADLLERMFALDPEKRITAKEALRHPFIARGLGGGQGQQQNGGGGGGRGR